MVFENLLKTKKSDIEAATGYELFPTYSFARIYKTGNELKKHKDRPSCEISVTLKLGESKKFNWPIYINDAALNLDIGDAVVYKGCEVEHWREQLQEPDYFLGQVFLHYVIKDGKYESYRYDQNYHRQDFFENDLTKEKQ